MDKARDLTERSRLDALQSSFKILINSFYGYLGYGRGLFNDYGQADRVTQIGQKLLRETIGNIVTAGGKVLEADTDGIFFLAPDRIKDEVAERGFVKTLSDQMPKGITLTLDGRYRRMLSYKKKNYALLGYDGHVTVKGSSLISRSMERFGRQYMREAVECLLNNDIDGLHRLYTSYHRRILERTMDIKDLCRTETLKDTLAQYAREIEAGNRNRSATYEVAIASGRTFKAGDRVTYYVTGNDPNPRSFENCKSAEEWDPNFRDENTPFYLRRLDEFSEKFKEFFLPQDFRAIFSADDLFPFSSAGITPVTGSVSDESQATPAEGRSEEPGTWLDE